VGRSSSIKPCLLTEGEEVDAGEFVTREGNSAVLNRKTDEEDSD